MTVFANAFHGVVTLVHLVLLERNSLVVEILLDQWVQPSTVFQNWTMYLIQALETLCHLMTKTPVRVEFDDRLLMNDADRVCSYRVCIEERLLNTGQDMKRRISVVEIIHGSLLFLPRASLAELASLLIGKVSSIRGTAGAVEPKDLILGASGDTKAI